MNRNRLTLSDRIKIESGIYSKRTFEQIAESMNRATSTVSREVLNNRTLLTGERPRGKDCAFASRCCEKGICGDELCFRKCSLCTKYQCTELCEKYRRMYCRKLESPPYVCNTCKDRRNCKHDRAYYIAQQAEELSKRRRSESRRGVHLGAEEVDALDKLVTPLVRKGQPLTHICASHKEDITVSQRTLYNYIDSGVLSLKNIDLRRKVGYRPRRKKKIYNLGGDKVYLEGRMYEDYLRYLQEHHELQPVEMDTVKGCREQGKRLLNLVFCENNLMLSFLMPDGTADSVLDVFDYLSSILGAEKFKELFPVILTDNGGEFKRVKELETTEDGETRTRIFFCDPYSSWQKPHIEKNQEYIRYVIPKGHSLSGYTQEDVTLLSNNINSTRRIKFKYDSPYELVKSEAMLFLMNALGLAQIPQDEVCLTPKLLSRGTLKGDVAI